MSDEIQIRSYNYVVLTDGETYEVEVRSQVQYVVEILGGGGSGTDSNAVHVNVSSEINGVTEKVTPVSADLLLIEDSEDSNSKKKLQVGNLPGSGSGDVVGPASSTNLEIPLFDGPTGKLLTNSGVTLGGSQLAGIDSVLSQGFGFLANEALDQTFAVTNIGAGDYNMFLGGALTITGAINGRNIATDGAKLDGIEAGADVTDSVNVAAAGAIMETDVGAKGDLFVASADDAVQILSIGSDGQVLTADSAEITGVKWATPASSGEANTASSAGTGTSLFYQKTGVDLEFNAIKSENDRITISLDGITHDVEVTLNEGNIVHQNLSGAGTNTHAQIDTHLADGTIHFTEASIDHTAIQNIGTNTHAQIDTHIADGTIHFTEASIDHTAIQNIGTNTHAQIDTHIADGTIHFTEASIDHTAIQNIGTNTHAQIDSHIASTSNPHSVTAAQVGNTTAQWNANQIQGAAVTITSIVDGEILVYDTGAWVNKTLAEAGISAVGHTHAASDIVSGTFADARIAQSNVTQHQAAIDHDALTNFVANEHINHTSVTLTAGEGLTGGGDISANRSFALNVNGLTEESGIVTGDFLVFYDTSAGAHRKINISDLPGGTDPDAIHDNVSGEINAITEKVTPVSGDWLLIEDSAASNAKKKVQVGNLPGGSGTDADAIHDNVGSEISAITEKTSLVDGDIFLIEDSEASNAKKKVLYSTFKEEWTPGPGRAVFWDDFWANDYSGDHDYYRGVSGGGVGPTYGGNDSGSCGVHVLYTGTGASNYAYIRVYNGFDAWVDGGGETTFVAYVKFETLVNGTDEYSFRVGIGDSSTGSDHTDGIYFELDVNTSGYVLNGCAIKGGTSTKTDTGSTITTNTWYQLKWVIAADGSQVDFYVYGGGSLLGSCTVTTNLPSSGYRCGQHCQLAKDGTGSTNIQVFIDYWGLKKDFTTPRY